MLVSFEIFFSRMYCENSLLLILFTCLNICRRSRDVTLLIIMNTQNNKRLIFHNTILQVNCFATDITFSFSSILSKSDSFNAGRNRIRAAFNLVGMEFREDGEPVTGRVDFKMKHIRLQNRHLQIYAKPRKHTFFDDDGNVLAVETTTEEVGLHYSRS